MSRLERRIPPVVVALIAALLGWAAARGVPSLAMPIPAAQPIAFVCASLGLIVALAGVAEFRRAGTTVNPLGPAETRQLVTSGIYRFTRNPMYLGMLLALIAWALWLGNPAGLLGWPLFVGYLNRFQIRPEEAALTDLFGNQYLEYGRRVRRWL